MKLHLSPDLSLPLEAVTQTFAVLAKRGAGKTYTGAVMVEEMLEAGQQVIVADPIGVWWGLRSSADGKSAGYPIVVFGGEHADVPLEENSGEVIAGAIVEHGFSAILDLSLLRKNAQVRFMTAFAETLYRLNRKPLHFAVDEADAFAPQRPMKGEERLLGAFEDIVRRGRARGLGVTLITQRAAVINKNVLTQIEVLVALRTISPQDRDALEAWVEVHGTKEQQGEFFASVASLPIGTAWFWSPGWLDIFKCVKIRKRRTFDSSSTPKVGETVHAPKHIATVDLNKLGDQIKSTAEKAKENDPAELKRKLAAAKKEISALQQAAPIQKVVGEKRVEVPVLKDSQIERLIKHYERILAEAEKHGKAMSLFWDNQLEEAQALLGAIKSVAGHKQPLLRPVANRQIPVRVRAPRMEFERPKTNGESSEHFPIGERKILTALIQFPDGLRREQLTVLTTFKRSTRDAYIQRLREKDFVSVNGELVFATDSGIAALPSAEPLPTGEALQQHWLAKLPEGERRILEVLLADYPNAVTRDSISEITEFKRSTRDAYLHRMAAKQLIVEPTRGEVKASDALFE